MTLEAFETAQKLVARSVRLKQEIGELEKMLVGESGKVTLTVAQAPSFYQISLDCVEAMGLLSDLKARLIRQLEEVDKALQKL